MAGLTRAVSDSKEGELTTPTDSDSRASGIEFSDLNERLDSLEFPLTLDAFLASVGDARIEVSDETTTVREIVAPLDDEQFESADDARDTSTGLVGDDAIGRKGYSDRGDSSPGTDEEGSDESL